MSGAIQIPRFGFHNHVQAIISEDGQGVSGQLTFADGVVGVAAIVPGTASGMRVTGIHGSVDFEANTFDVPGLRLVVVGLNGQPEQLAGLLNSFSSLVGALNQIPANNPATSGLVIPDLTTLQLNPAAGAGSPNALQVFCDETSNPSNYGGPPGLQQLKFGEDRGAIQIPPFMSVAGIIIALRAYDGTQTPTTVLSLGMTVHGALEGYLLTPADVTADQGITPARFGNVRVGGSV